MISVVIPHMPIGESESWLRTCVRSLPTFIGETIIVVNNGEGYSKAVNRGLALARGDYLIVATNDTQWLGGKLEDLCDKKALCSPMVNGKALQFGAFFCISRRLYEVVGGFDEQFRLGYYEDNDYALRIEKAGFGLYHTEKCRVAHHGGATMKAMGQDVVDEVEAENRLKFEAKWGRPA